MTKQNKVILIVAIVAGGGVALVTLLLILATLAIPATQAVIRHGNETSAVNSIKFLVTEENNYATTYPSHGFSCSLAALGGHPGAAAPTPEFAQMIGDDLASGHKAGYTYAIDKCVKVTIKGQDQVTSYELTAVPNAVGHTGNRGFCSDENGQVRFDPKGGTDCTGIVEDLSVTGKTN
jgi:type IV pilus assembly protein PilA